MLDPPRLTPDGDFCDGGKRSAPDARHAGRTSFAYTDGHVSALNPRKLGYRLNPDGSFKHTGPDVSNRYFSGTGRDDDPARTDGG
jgi:prepilin-type processing-associated H-X9-DG protein